VNKTPNSGAESLEFLKRGQTATVAYIAAAESTAKRLADIGFVRGAAVTVLRPGRPCLVRIGPTCVGLGLALQRCVVVTA